MFTVVIRALADSAEDMQQMVRKLNQQIQETEDIVSSIRRLSEYDEVRRALRFRLQEMETEKRRLMDMMAALNQIQSMYRQCERNITDFGDQVRSRNNYRAMSAVRLDSVRAGIQAYHIR